MVSIKNKKINGSVKKIIKEFKTIWVDGNFTPIFIVSVLCLVIIPFLPEGKTIVNNCFF
jgi:hypothetical protein